jgi:hypothetical protein
MATPIQKGIFCCNPFSCSLFCIQEGFLDQFTTTNQWSIGYKWHIKVQRPLCTLRCHLQSCDHWLVVVLKIRSTWARVTSCHIKLSLGKLAQSFQELLGNMFLERKMCTVPIPQRTIPPCISQLGHLIVLSGNFLWWSVAYSWLLACERSGPQAWLVCMMVLQRNWVLALVSQYCQQSPPYQLQLSVMQTCLYGYGMCLDCKFNFAVFYQVWWTYFSMGDKIILRGSINATEDILFFCVVSHPGLNQKQHFEEAVRRSDCLRKCCVFVCSCRFGLSSAKVSIDNWEEPATDGICLTILTWLGAPWPTV